MFRDFFLYFINVFAVQKNHLFEWNGIVIPSIIHK